MPSKGQGEVPVLAFRGFRVLPCPKPWAPNPAPNLPPPPQDYKNTQKLAASREASNLPRPSPATSTSAAARGAGQPATGSSSSYVEVVIEQQVRRVGTLRDTSDGFCVTSIFLLCGQELLLSVMLMWG